MQSAFIPLARIVTRPDARKIDEATVKGLVESIREIGIINPLRVRETRAYVDGVEADAYEVIAGGHRLRASRLLGLEEAPCIVVKDDDLRAELAMIDENLCRTQMGDTERARYSARRKTIYEALHPETRHGGVRPSRQDGDLPNVVRFTADTAASTGRSERAVQRDVSRGQSIAEDVLDRIAGSALDTGAYLDRLKKLSHDDQRSRVARALAQPETTVAKTSARALTDAEAVEKQFQTIVAAWNRAGPEAREQFKAEYIDTPVMNEKWG